ncbi:hypothetical protein A3L23_00773 [Rhodococcoides fascians D188]|nr:hypothetical protein A3L23_00773 [Rhodococcus fascians D188]
MVVCHQCHSAETDRCRRPVSPRVKLGSVVIFFEVLLALAAVAIIAFSLYVVYRLVNDES